jgi:cytochrome c oxidase assembly protein subunit 15
LVLAIPFFVLLMRRQIRPGMRLRLANLPLLAAMQGGMGWYMVQSGLSGRTSVSPYRLVAHLAIALVIFGVAVWTATELRTPREQAFSIRGRESRRGLFVLLTLATLVFVTMLSGGFVAGLDAGKIFNTFPLMDGRLIPVGYGAMESWRNAFENPVAAQLHHRILASGTVVLVCLSWLVAVTRVWPRALHRWLSTAAVIAAIQVGLGVATIVLAVPLPIAVMHQLGALALLAVLLAAAARESGFRKHGRGDP